MGEWFTRVFFTATMALLTLDSSLGWEISEKVRTDLVRFETEDSVQLNGALYRPDPQVNPHPKRAILVTHGTGGSFYGSIAGFLPP